MAASLRSQRIVQRLAASTPGTRPLFFTSNTRRPISCVACQARALGTPTPSLQVHRLSQQRRPFTSTPSTSDSSQTEPGANSIPGAPDTTNFYTIFPKTLPAGPPPASPFNISQGDLRREFLQLQNIIHPDKYPPGPTKQQAEALSARINEAYRTLLDPLHRAQYLLRELHGIDVTAEDGASHHPLDPELLMEVMDVQETIEEVGAEPDAEARIAELKKENDVRIAECVRGLGAAFDSGDIDAARHESVRLKFWYSVGHGLREWEPGTTQIRLVH